MLIEFARNICGLERADSTEFNPGTPHRVIFKLRELKGIDDLGGRQRGANAPTARAKSASGASSLAPLARQAEAEYFGGAARTSTAAG
jgi:CTP synthase (UTP-ammonia lyase)